jgi:NTE family protein
MNPLDLHHPRRWLRQEGEFGTSACTEPNTPSPPKKIGLALSSGGARGLAHVGVIEVLEENDIPIAALAGCSMGAYVGALWAAGLNSRRLVELAAEIKDRKTLFKLLDFQFPPSRGLISGNRIRAHLERDLGGLTFAELRTPSLFVATDLDSLDAHIFDSGNVATAVHASAAIPGVCIPVVIDGHRYTDGGASEPLPASLLRRHFALDHILSVNVMPSPGDFESCRDFSARTCRGKRRASLILCYLRRLLRFINLMEDGNVLDTFRRSLMSAQLRLIQKECAASDIVIQPRFERSSWHDFENFDHYIRAGRQAALAALPQIQALLAPPKPSPIAPNLTPTSSLISNN